MPGRRASSSLHDDAGTVTAELAIGLVGVTLLSAALLSTVVVGVAKVETTGAAAAGARAAARGEPGGVVSAAAARVAGAAADVSVHGEGDFTTVRVTRRVQLALPGAPSVVVDSQAVALTESREP